MFSDGGVSVLNRWHYENCISFKSPLTRVREMRGGKEYDSDFSKRMHGEGVWADLIRQRFTKTVKKLGIAGVNQQRFEKLDFSRFKRPLMVPPAAGKQTGNATGQLDLF